MDVTLEGSPILRLRIEFTIGKTATLYLRMAVLCGIAKPLRLAAPSKAYAGNQQSKEDNGSVKDEQLEPKLVAVKPTRRIHA